MPGKIFINYRRDDDPNGAARVRDGLAAKFGKPNIFMDVDNLLAGQRFDEELAKALAQCDVLIAIIGPRWMELMKARTAAGERDYVREEIAEALARKLIVIPVRVGREGQLPALPRAQDLPEGIRDLVLYQKHDVAHERFGRDVTELIEAITTIRRNNRPQLAAPTVPWNWVGATAAVVLVAAYIGAHAVGIPVPWPGATAAPEIVLAPSQKQLEDAARKSVVAEQREKEIAEQRQKEAATKQRADEEAKAKAADAERVRLAALKAEEERQLREKAAAEAKRRADEEAARRVPQPGQTFRDCTDGCPEMVVVPAGDFTMGSADFEEEKRPHRVTIAKPFAVGKFEVTFDEWEACVAGGGCTGNSRPSDEGWGRGKRPVINVSWSDANEYVSWLSRKTGKSYRLLSEAEWEYAARAGGPGRFTFGDDDSQLGQYAWYSANAGGKTQPVGEKKANAFGLHDLHGNVWEWVEDSYHSNYKGAPSDGSGWSAAGSSNRVLRGGSWGLNPDSLRSYLRSDLPPDYRGSSIGSRLARTL